MNWYTLPDLQRLAMKKGKFVCGWRPINMTDTTLEGRFVHDPSGRRGEYKQHSKWSIKVICEKTGVATVRYPDKPEGELRAEIIVSASIERKNEEFFVI